MSRYFDENQVPIRELFSNGIYKKSVSLHDDLIKNGYKITNKFKNSHDFEFDKAYDIDNINVKIYIIYYSASDNIFKYQIKLHHKYFKNFSKEKSNHKDIDNENSLYEFLIEIDELFMNFELFTYEETLIGEILIKNKYIRVVQNYFQKNINNKKFILRLNCTKNNYNKFSINNKLIKTFELKEFNENFLISLENSENN